MTSSHISLSQLLEDAVAAAAVFSTATKVTKSDRCGNNYV